MAGGWRRVTAEERATYRIQGCLDEEELEGLSVDLTEAAEAGFHHLVLDLHDSCEQSVTQWSAFRPVLEALTRKGARLSVEGAGPDLLAGLHSATVEAQMRLLDRQFPFFFSKQATT